MLAKLSAGGLQLDEKVLEEMQNVRELVTSMRSLKADRNLSNNRNVAFSFLAENEKAAPRLSVAPTSYRNIEKCPDALLNKSPKSFRDEFSLLNKSTPFDRNDITV